ncbi:MAG TPA: enoyl-CoA hydratase-related protein [Polyangia bacterium]|nr:enoyl-CoA hydratase-related protein [Polyangia bacterium]
MGDPKTEHASEQTKEHIEARSDGVVRVITLARPEKRNAFTFAMYDALARALARADADDDVRVVLIEGAGGAFTAGNDLADFLQLSGAGAANGGDADADAGAARTGASDRGSSANAARASASGGNSTTRAGASGDDGAAVRVLLQLVDQQKPIVCAVDGVAIGIGTTMLLHADYIAASTRARFALPFVNLGLSPEGGSSLLLPMLVGLQRASEWLLFGEPFDAARAMQAGLVNEVVEPEALATRAMARARALAERPAAALAAAKRLLREPLRAQVKATIEREWHVFVERLASPEATQAMQAFLQKKR